MKKLVFLFVCMASAGPLSAMIRAGVDAGPNQGVYVDNGYYYGSDWYGPGVYYGVYYDDAPAYYAWRSRYYYGGPYYWRHRHGYYGRHGGYYHGGHRGGGRHH